MRTLFSLSVLLATVLVATPLAAQSTKVYQWKDSSGVTHYSDSPPPGQRPKERRIDTRGSAVAEAQDEEKPDESPQCKQARFNLQALSSSSPVQQDTDGDGKPDKILTDAERGNQKALAEAAVKAYCTSAPAK
ncbi:DUF4124 domain-containing protein [Pseudoxanthomonas kalamensis DSM 18571]|uniref:DUF4124 domain-containing protein n=1 Tax=Pseudoxanthomonas kalamensis TaxID=289483 RepID=UPI0013920822|nr:DUF4124 domain-containing protein [Pseudoxanthomonas kalamensis]KAF1708973.1 DUF4124 domain-containing protein [Pseudoxanthomonas kalamensis DSM 18571]